jgi:hypothetical protein
MPSLFIKHVILPAVAIICLASCNSNKVKEKKAAAGSVIAVSKNLSPADSLQLVHDIDSADYLALFKNKTNIWISKMLDDPGAKWANFHLVDFWKKTDHPPRPGTLTKNFVTDYAMFLKWSPDSTYMLDIGSYGVTMARDKNGQLYVESGDVDSEIDLYNINEKTSERMLFFGPSTIAIGAHWADSVKVALLGLFNKNDNHHPDTILWIINAKEKFFSKYVYHRQ